MHIRSIKYNTDTTIVVSLGLIKWIKINVVSCWIISNANRRKLCMQHFFLRCNVVCLKPGSSYSIHSMVCSLSICVAGKSQNIKLVWSERAQHFYFILFSSNIRIHHIWCWSKKKKCATHKKAEWNYTHSTAKKKNRAKEIERERA